MIARFIITLAAAGGVSFAAGCLLAFVDLHILRNSTPCLCNTADETADRTADETADRNGRTA